MCRSQIRFRRDLVTKAEEEEGACGAQQQEPEGAEAHPDRQQDPRPGAGIDVGCQARCGIDVHDDDGPLAAFARPSQRLETGTGCRCHPEGLVEGCPRRPVPGDDGRVGAERPEVRPGDAFMGDAGQPPADVRLRADAHEQRPVFARGPKPHGSDRMDNAPVAIPGRLPEVDTRRQCVRRRREVLRGGRVITRPVPLGSVRPHQDTAAHRDAHSNESHQGAHDNEGYAPRPPAARYLLSARICHRRPAFRSALRTTDDDAPRPWRWVGLKVTISRSGPTTGTFSPIDTAADGAW
jgi:hypothetical protein